MGLVPIRPKTAEGRGPWGIHMLNFEECLRLKTENSERIQCDPALERDRLGEKKL